MSHDIHLARVRNKLDPRPEPYWGAPLAKGKFIGFRKIEGKPGAWVARYRGESLKQQYKALGYITDDFDFDQAKAAAEEWFKSLDAGIQTDEVETVADACRQYVEDRKREKGETTAHDAEMRFRRTVYGTAFGNRRLEKLRTIHIKHWRDGLKLAPATSNRTLTALKAALNLAVVNRQVPASAVQEWKDVKPMKGAGNRRGLYLDLGQRRALLKATTGAVGDLIEAAMLTGARAGELVKAARSQFDARTGSMTFTGKTGSRTIPLSPAAVALFKRLARSKLPTAHLLTRDDGEPWAHSDWDGLVREAATKAKLPRGVCLYTLRHSWITAAIEGGMNPLEVARLVGTSLVMIERHYGHLANKGARDRLAKVEMV